MIFFKSFCYLCLNGFALYLLANAELQCRLTTNVGNLSAANLQDRLILNCSSISCKHKASIKWKKDGKLLNESSPVVSKNNVTREDAGKYECILVKGECSSERCFVFVKINAPPRVKIAPYENFRHSLRLTCVVEGYPKPTVVWYKNSTILFTETLKNGSCYETSNKAIDVQSYEWILVDNCTSKSEDGNYTCLAKNKYGENKKSIEVFDWEGDIKCPKFQFPEETNLTVDTGKSITLLCSVTFPSNRYLDIYRIFPRTADKNHVYTHYYESRSKLVMNFTIVTAAKNDTGSYSCSYMSLLKLKCKNLLKIFNLNVREPPKASSGTKKVVYIVAAVSAAVVLVGLGLAFYLLKKRLKSQRFYAHLANHSQSKMHLTNSISQLSDQR